MNEYHSRNANTALKPPDQRDARRTLIFIASDARSGSTMLDNMLSNNPQAESVGKLTHLHSHLNKKETGVSWDWKCTCGCPMEQCPIWSKAAKLHQRHHGHRLEELKTKPGRDIRSSIFHCAMALAILVPVRLLQRPLVRASYRQRKLKARGTTLYRIVDSFSRVLDTNIVIDSSKNADYLHCLIDAQPEGVDLKLIHIVRDGRAVLYSKMKRSEQYRKYGASFGLLSAIRGSWSINSRIRLAAECLPPEDTILVRYEDLCESREAILDAICERFGLSFCPEMLYLSSNNKHNVGGTSHRFTWNPEVPIRLDTRWKEGLGRWPRLVYHAFAGRLHKKLGY